MITLRQIAEILEAAAARARELDDEQRNARTDWIDQSQSALGPRRHARAVRRRLARAEAGAARVGRRWLLSPEALREELARGSRSTDTEKPLSPADKLRATLAKIPGNEHMSAADVVRMVLR